MRAWEKVINLKNFWFKNISRIHRKSKASSRGKISKVSSQVSLGLAIPYLQSKFLIFFKFKDIVNLRSSFRSQFFRGVLIEFLFLLREFRIKGLLPIILNRVITRLFAFSDFKASWRLRNFITLVLLPRPRRLLMFLIGALACWRCLRKTLPHKLEKNKRI